MHPWAEKEAVTTTDLAKEHFLLYHRNSVTFRRAEDFFLRSGVGLSSYVEIPSFEIMKQLAKLGLGVALMAPWVAEKELAEGSLIMRPTPRSKIVRQWTVIHQGNRELRKPEQTFIGLCRMAVAGLGRRSEEPTSRAPESDVSPRRLAKLESSSRPLHPFDDSIHDIAAAIILCFPARRQVAQPREFGS